MKKLIFICLFLAPYLLYAQDTTETVLVGKISRATLFGKKHKETYQPEYDRYQPNANAVKFLKTKKGKVQIKLVMGTWCDDSKLYVPRLIKALDMANWDTDETDQLKIIAVDRDKQAGFEGYAALMITKVPTMIVIMNDMEIGRIEEIPKASVEEDLMKIIQDYAK